MTADEPTFGEVLRQAIRARGLSLERIHARLGADYGLSVSMATLSYWQSGRAVPRRSSSQEAVRALETILEVAPGTLLAPLDRERASRRQQRWSRRHGGNDDETIIGLLAKEHGVAPREARVVGVRSTLVIGADRVEKREIVHALIIGEKDDARHFQVFARQDTAVDVTPAIEALSGCQIGSVFERPTDQSVFVDLVLPRPLRRGEALMVDYQVLWGPTDEPTTRHDRIITFQQRELGLRGRFDPSAVPQTVQYAVRDSIEQPLSSATTVSVPIVDGVAEVVRLDVPLGVHGLYWTWPD